MLRALHATCLLPFLASFRLPASLSLSTSPIPPLSPFALCEHFIKIMHHSVATPPAASLAAVSAFLLA